MIYPSVAASIILLQIGVHRLSIDLLYIHAFLCTFSLLEVLFLPIFVANYYFTEVEHFAAQLCAFFILLHFVSEKYGREKIEIKIPKDALQ